MQTKRKRPNLSLKKTIKKAEKVQNQNNSMINKTENKENTPNITNIADNLFISDYHFTKDEKNLKDKNISVIINLANQHCQNSFPDRYIYKTFEISDRVTTEIGKEISNVTKIIEDYISKGENVLVHCFKGISRAPTMAIAYMMKFRGMEFNEAFDHVRKKNDGIDPNAGFLIQLNAIPTN